MTPRAKPKVADFTTESGTEIDAGSAVAKSPARKKPNKIVQEGENYAATLQEA